MCDKIKHVLLEIEHGVEQYIQAFTRFLLYATMTTFLHGDGFIKWVKDTVVFWVRTYHWFAVLSILLLIIIVVEVRIDGHQKRTARRAAEVAHIA